MNPTADTHDFETKLQQAKAFKKEAMAGYREDNSPPPGPAPHTKALERDMTVNILGIEYRVHHISHGGKKLSLRRI